MTIAFKTGVFAKECGTGDWSDMDCGCRYAIGRNDAQVYLIPCDSHFDGEAATEKGKEVVKNENE